MPTQNPDVAGKFEKEADPLETEVESRFKIEAYRDAGGYMAGGSYPEPLSIVNV
jgi:DNA polymerase/3'-5' exonuclease PolX